MKAIIPAAGIGKRLQPHTLNRPKVMVPVAGKPILEHISSALLEAGFNEISVIVGYKKESIVDYFTAKYPGTFTFPVQEEMKGLAHAVLYGLDDVEEPVLIILGDTIIDMDLSIFHDGRENMIAVVEVEDPKRFGIVETDEKGRITGMVEKPENPTSNQAIAGVYFLKNQQKLKQAIETLIRDDIRTRNEYQLTDALALMMRSGEPFRAVPIKAWYDCGTPETLLSTNRFLLTKHAANHGTCVDCILHEPVYIGKGTRIEHSEIGPDVAIGNDVKILHSCIKNSMVFAGAVLQDVDLHDSLIGEGTDLRNTRGSYNISDER